MPEIAEVFPEQDQGVMLMLTDVQLDEPGS